MNFFEKYDFRPIGYWTEEIDGWELDTDQKPLASK